MHEPKGLDWDKYKKLKWVKKILNPNNCKTFGKIEVFFFHCPYLGGIRHKSSRDFCMLVSPVFSQE